jgi:hypothetical protein
MRVTRIAAGMNLRYIVAQVLPDISMETGYNTGVILQSDEWVGSKFLERAPESWGLRRGFEHVAVRMQPQVWRVRLSAPQSIYIVGQGPVTVQPTDRRYLEAVWRGHGLHLIFSRIHSLEADIEDSQQYGALLASLYDMYVVRGVDPHAEEELFRPSCILAGSASMRAPAHT